MRQLDQRAPGRVLGLHVVAHVADTDGQPGQHIGLDPGGRGSDLWGHLVGHFRGGVQGDGRPDGVSLRRGVPERRQERTGLRCAIKFEALVFALVRRDESEVVE